ncbi:MAG: cyclic nucleotide-binding protein, partial [Rhizobiales bacterium 39-66-18]
MSLEQDVALLQDVPTFDMLTPDALRTLAISADQLRLAAGDILFQEGDLADAGYVLTSGRLEM